MSFMRSRRRVLMLVIGVVVLAVIADRSSTHAKPRQRTSSSPATATAHPTSTSPAPPQDAPQFASMPAIAALGRRIIAIDGTFGYRADAVTPATIATLTNHSRSFVSLRTARKRLARYLAPDSALRGTAQSSSGLSGGSIISVSPARIVVQSRAQLDNVSGHHIAIVSASFTSVQVVRTRSDDISNSGKVSVVTYDAPVKLHLVFEHARHTWRLYGTTDTAGTSALATDGRAAPFPSTPVRPRSVSTMKIKHARPPRHAAHVVKSYRGSKPPAPNHGTIPCRIQKLDFPHRPCNKNMTYNVGG